MSSDCRQTNEFFFWEEIEKMRKLVKTWKITNFIIFCARKTYKEKWVDFRSILNVSAKWSYKKFCVLLVCFTSTKNYSIIIFGFEDMADLSMYWSARFVNPTLYNRCVILSRKPKKSQFSRRFSANTGCFC